MMFDLKSGLYVPRRSKFCSLFPAVHGIAGASGGGLYAANGVNFDGTNDYLTRGADLTGNADSKKGIIYFRFKFNGGDGVNQIFYQNGSTNRFEFLRRSTGKWRFTGRNTGGSINLRIETSGTYTADGSWHSFLASWDLAVPGSGSIYVDDTKDYSESTFDNSAIDYTQTEHALCANTGGTSRVNGCVADYYVNFAEFLDFDTVANRRLFTDAADAPVDLGSDGSTPTGTAPIIFLSGETASWHTNKGTGGGFTENGALTDCATDP